MVKTDEQMNRLPLVEPQFPNAIMLIYHACNDTQIHLYQNLLTVNESFCLLHRVMASDRDVITSLKTHWEVECSDLRLVGW